MLVTCEMYCMIFGWVDHLIALWFSFCQTLHVPNEPENVRTIPKKMTCHYVGQRKKKRGETVPALFLLNSFLFPFLADLFETVKRKRKQNNRNSIANVLSGLRINYAPNYLIELWAHLIFLLSNSILSSIEKRYLPLAARQLLAIRAMWAFATAFVRVHA